FLSRFKSNEIENELAIFNSKRIISRAVEELRLNIKYEIPGNIKTTEIYEYRPFEVQYQSFVDTLSNKVPVLYFEILSDSEFLLEDDTYGNKATYKFGERITLPFGDITVLPNMEFAEKFNSYKNKTIIVTYSTVEK